MRIAKATVAPYYRRRRVLLFGLRQITSLITRLVENLSQHFVITATLLMEMRNIICVHKWDWFHMRAETTVIFIEAGTWPGRGNGARQVCDNALCWWPCVLMPTSRNNHTRRIYLVSFRDTPVWLPLQPATTKRFTVRLPWVSLHTGKLYWNYRP